MKKTHKKVLGLLGLSVVVATTAFAITLPGPEASAINEVVDRLEVRVVGSTPSTIIEGINSGEEFINPDHAVTIKYENVEYIDVVLEYTDVDGNTQTVTLIDRNSPEGYVDYAAGEKTIPLNLKGGGLGYGDYVIKVVGDGSGEEKSGDTVRFGYYPVKADIDEDENTGKTYVDLDYTADDGTEEGEGNVSSIVINVFGPDGNIVNELSPTNVTPPTKQVELPFYKYNLPEGRYTIELTAYDRNGEVLYKKYIIYYIYKPTHTKIPDTGGVFQNLNISKTDYLVTGIGVFLAIGITSALFVAKRNKKSSKRRR